MLEKLSIQNKAVETHDLNVYELLVGSVNRYAIVALDPAGFVLTWNNGAERIFGYKEAEIVGKSFSLLQDGSDSNSRLKEDLRRIRKSGQLTEDAAMVRRDGTHVLVKMDSSCMNIEGSKQGGYALIMRDMSERQLAEEKLKQSEEMFTLMVSAVKDYAIFFLDADGQVMTWNEGARRIKGYDAQEIIGKHFSQFYPQAAKDIQHPQKELELAKERGHYEEEGWRVRKDGSQFWASVTITPVKDHKGKLRGFVKVTRDLTERRRTEVERENARLEALKLSELKSQFVANVSHEIRTPMAGIIGMAEELVLDESLNEEQHEAAELVFNSSMRLLGVLNDILDFSKLEAGKISIELSSFDLGSAINEVVATAQPVAAKKGISMSLILDPGLPNTIVADENKLRQVLSNLVHNAIKFTNYGGVTIEAENEDDILKFVVKDTGIGISEAAQSSLFRPFVQVDGTSRRRYGGTGLGLSIAKRNVELMNGKIGCDSKEGEGSEFWFTIPWQAVI